MLSKRHPDTIYHMTLLTMTRYAQEKYDEAEKFESCVLQLRRVLLGRKDSDTIYGMTYLASVYHVQQKYCEVEEIYLKVL